MRKILLLRVYVFVERPQRVWSWGVGVFLLIIEIVYGVSMDCGRSIIEMQSSLVLSVSCLVGELFVSPLLFPLKMLAHA